MGPKPRSKEEGNWGTERTQAESRQSENTSLEDGQPGQKAGARPAEDRFPSFPAHTTSEDCNQVPGSGARSQRFLHWRTQIWWQARGPQEPGQFRDRQVRLRIQVWYPAIASFPTPQPPLIWHKNEGMNVMCHAPQAGGTAWKHPQQTWSTAAIVQLCNHSCRI